MLVGEAEVTCPPESGPAVVRVTIARVGRGGDSHEGQEAFAGADRQEAQGGGPVAGGGQRRRRGLPAVGDLDSDLPALAQPVEGDAAGRRGPVEAAGERRTPACSGCWPRSWTTTC